jgi:cytochrome c556
MEKIGDQSWKELLKIVGKTVEDSGRMLRRESPFTAEELKDLQRTLEHSANTLKIIRKSADKEV